MTDGRVDQCMNHQQSNKAPVLPIIPLSSNPPDTIITVLLIIYILLKQFTKSKVLVFFLVFVMWRFL